MGISYQIEDRILIVTLAGHYALAEVTETTQAILTDSAYQPGLLVMVDARLSEVLPATNEIPRRMKMIQELSAFFSPRYAVVVSRKVQYGIVRMLAAWAAPDTMEIRAFYRPEDARQWLLADLSGDV